MCAQARHKRGHRVASGQRCLSLSSHVCQQLTPWAEAPQGTSGMRKLLCLPCLLPTSLHPQQRQPWPQLGYSEGPSSHIPAQAIPETAPWNLMQCLPGDTRHRKAGAGTYSRHPHNLLNFLVWLAFPWAHTDDPKDTLLYIFAHTHTRIY